MRHDRFASNSRNWRGGGPGRLYTVLDIGTSKICCMIARQMPHSEGDGRNGSKPDLKVLALSVHKSAGIKGGFIVDMNAAEQAIRVCVSRAESKVGVTVEDVVLSVTCGRLKSLNFLASDQISGRAVEASDINRVMAAAHAYAARNGRVVLHLLPIRYSIDQTDGIRDPRGMIGHELAADIHSVVAEEQALKNLMQAVERCHLSVSALVATPYASGMSAIVEDEAKLGVACIDIGGGTTKLAVFADGHFVYSDVIVLGGNNVTHDIAGALSCSLQDAERIKTLNGSVVTAVSDENELISVPKIGQDDNEFNQLTRAQLGLMIKPRMEEILTVIRDRLNKSGFSLYTGQRVVLTGGSSLLPGLTGLAARILNKSVRVGVPKPLAGVSDQTLGPEFATAAGLQLYCLRPQVHFDVNGEQHFLNTGTGYLARMGNWLKESF